MKIVHYANGEDEARDHPWVPGGAFISNPQLEPLLKALEESGIETAEEFRAMRRTQQVESADALRELLYAMNDNGEHPVVLMVDRTDTPGLAYLYEVGGDEVYPHVLTDGWSEGNDHDQELSERYYPATILWKPEPA